MEETIADESGPLIVNEGSFIVDQKDSYFQGEQTVIQ